MAPRSWRRRYAIGRSINRPEQAASLVALPADRRVEARAQALDRGADHEIR
jgi:hypothetical protein